MQSIANWCAEPFAIFNVWSWRTNCGDGEKVISIVLWFVYHNIFAAEWNAVRELFPPYELRVNFIFRISVLWFIFYEKLTIKPAVLSRILHS